MTDNQCCGTCKYHIWGRDGDYICDCPDSEGYGDFTGYRDVCEEFEER